MLSNKVDEGSKVKLFVYQPPDNEYFAPIMGDIINKLTEAHPTQKHILNPGYGARLKQSEKSKHPVFLKELIIFVCSYLEAKIGKSMMEL